MRSDWTTRAISAALITVLALGLAGAGYVAADEFRRHYASNPRAVTLPVHRAAAAPTVSVTLPAATARPTNSASEPASGTSATALPPLSSSIAAELSGPLADPALGPHLLAQVADAETGTVLFDQAGASAAAPASTAKLATAAALLTVRSATDRITTTVYRDAVPGQIVLVGAGDPTLSAAAATAATLYADAARISDLVTQIRASGIAVTQVVINGGLFSGPLVSPAWQRGDAPSTYASPITALMVDGGRDVPGASVRSGAPDVAAGVALATGLGLSSSVVVRGALPATATPVASVQSAPYAELVRQMLLDSDNVIAEVLARQVAIATAQPATFIAASAAIRATLVAHGVDIGAGLVDGSGLASTDRMSPAALVKVLDLVVATPRLRILIDGLPVADWDGTLAGRYDAGAALAAAGRVRAKTGTLSGVSALAGFTTLSDGRLLTFSFIVSGIGGSNAADDAAQAALDRLAAALSSALS
jgi:D-alanyl-D-alanine carboxypeptidase/D-alanyl-D-alanine-endopeptidase (penicillin-binding protein 4)